MLWNEEPIWEDLENYRTELRYMADQPALMSELKIIDNWSLYSSLFDLTGSSSTRLSSKLSLDQRGADLSHGQQKRVQLATLFGHEPNLLLMDEPMLALDESAQEALRERLRELQEAGSIIITASPKPASASDRLWKLTGRQ